MRMGWKACFIGFWIGAVKRIQHQNRIKHLGRWMAQYTHQIHTGAVKSLLSFHLLLNCSCHCMTSLKLRS